jgi:hypothetical protein
MEFQPGESGLKSEGLRSEGLSLYLPTLQSGTIAKMTHPPAGGSFFNARSGLKSEGLVMAVSSGHPERVPWFPQGLGLTLRL